VTYCESGRNLQGSDKEVWYSQTECEEREAAGCLQEVGVGHSSVEASNDRGAKGRCLGLFARKE